MILISETQMYGNFNKLLLLWTLTYFDELTKKSGAHLRHMQPQIMLPSLSCRRGKSNLLLM